ncbi:9562_t:CDS:2 [Paraglomus brasilianum]|uniref:9562_t:CDS:1 n=1 Tax=Paraglomus brasilianum TaxID=144538 RepID=A0A9N9FMB6_9GLOM|nr:9562_t:CDS:2 [Paraglomus brasilianum]
MTESSAEKVLAKAYHPTETSSHEEDTPPPYTPIATAHTATVVSPAGNELNPSKLETGRSTANPPQISTSYAANVSHPLTHKKGCCSRFWTSVFDPKAWTSVAYYLFVSPVVSLFAFVWMLTTLVGAITSLLFPPLGYFFCIGTAWSWRALGRIELITIKMCTHPARLFGCSSTRLFSTTHELPPRVFHPGSPQSPPPTYGAMRYAVKICFDKFTWMSFLYFTCIKFWITLLTFTTTITLFSLAFPLMLIFMPVLCITCRFMGEVEEKIAIAVLL